MRAIIRAICPGERPAQRWLAARRFAENCSCGPSLGERRRKSCARAEQACIGSCYRRPMRSFAVVVSAAGVMALGCSRSSADTADGPGTSGSAERSPYAYGAAVEDTGSNCPVGELPDPAQLSERADLPDPFEKLDGKRVTKRSEWRCRRHEIVEQAEKYIYGQKPAKPDKVSGTVSRDAVSVDVEHHGKRIHFSADIVLPAQGQGPFPAIINLGARGGSGGIRLGESLVLEQGVAIIYYNHNELGKEGKPEASRGLPNPGLFYDIYGGDHSAGLLMAWAWGASRILDVLQASGSHIIDATRVGVTGCSRNGKGAFTVGAFDERIALTIPQETSTGGVPAYRIVDVTDGAERTNWNYNGLNWLSNDFRPFVEHATKLPIDSHEIVALVAPRGLLVLDNPHIVQFGAAASHTAVLAGAQVYAALGASQNVSYISDIANEKHCATGKPEYTEPLIQSITKFLKHGDAAPATMKPSPSATANSSQWIHWKAPTLQSD
jgi:glucuronyl esterase-like protein